MAKALEKSASLPSALLMMNALPDAVLGFDAGLNIYFSNIAAQHFFNVSDKQLLSKDLSALLGPGVIEAAQTALRKNQTVTLHDVAIEGRSVSSVAVLPVDDSFFMLVIRPQAIQLNAEWNEKTKYTLKSTQMFAQMLAHEVKNPLAGIRGAAQLLEQLKLEEDDRELVTLIAKEAQRIQGLLEQFNIFDDVPQSRYSAVNLHEVLGHVTKVAKAEFGPNITIVEAFDPSLPNVRGHFDHLVQAALNLVKNAAESKKGRITLRTFYDNAAEFHPERPEKLPLCVEIEDDGNGIAPEALGKIFQPYYTTKANGKGLGLPIVSKIVDDHGGTIRVTSKPGRTVFKISLPVESKRVS